MTTLETTPDPASSRAGLSFPPGTLVVLVGIPGAGKSTFASQYPHTWQVSLDTFREMASDSAENQAATPVAVQAQNLFLNARLADGKTTIVDSTNVVPSHRQDLLAIAERWAAPSAAVLFDVPLAVAEAQNSSRTRKVRTEVLRSMHQQLPDVQQLRLEGFRHVYRLGPAEPPQ
ncbi:AAA family ATPase [Streptomyces sp. NPDC015125]|uniref:AAA family ATPase n=1 Tax=Streptomyces sp. NPDC015125 TaxID=3364938 RepID=UPI0036F7AD1C